MFIVLAVVKNLAARANPEPSGFALAVDLVVVFGVYRHFAALRLDHSLKLQSPSIRKKLYSLGGFYAFS
jgi:hypothetical protein